jgi:succinoglycan biosynthesis transport protein ExoP
MRMPEHARPGTPAEALERYVATLRRRWVLTVAIVLVAALAALAVSMQRPTSYTATAKVLLGQQRQVDALLGSGDYSSDPERELNTSVQLITLEPIADGVRAQLGLHEPAAALVGRVTTAIDRNSNIVSISVRDADAARAATLANAFAAAYRDYRGESARAGVQDAIASAEARLREVQGERERSALRDELTRLEVAEAFQTGGVQVVHEATAASAVRRPRPLTSAVLGGFVGIVLAALTIVLLARTDRRVSGDGDLEDLTGGPVVAHIPRSRSGAADALVTLALALAHGRVGRAQASVLLLTSAGPDEGTPEVAVGLARALGAIGKHAMVIEADLRTPAFAANLGLPDTGGLAAVLAGAATLEDELVDLGTGAIALPAGAAAELPQALLAGERMSATVEEACGCADVVLIAGAPVGRVGDSAVLAGLVDEVLLVARVDVSRLEELRLAVRALADAGIPPAGVVSTVRPSRRPFAAMAAARRRRSLPARDAAAATTATSEVTVG